MEEIGKKKSALKSIRAFCLDCCGSANEVKLCPCIECALYDYRLGKSNRVKKILTDEQKAVVAERFKKARESK